MKKLLILLLTACCLTGCQSAAPEAPTTSEAATVAPIPEDTFQTEAITEPPIIAPPDQNHTDFPGVTVRVDSLDTDEETGNASLVVVWVNETAFEVTYGSAYVIERLEEDTWVSCAMHEDIAFDCLGYSLQPGQQQTRSYNLAFTYDVSQPGTYRFRTDCYVYDSAESSSKCVVSAMFQVGSLSLQHPPIMTVRTKSGESVHKAVNFDWSAKQPDGTILNTITDASQRPPAEELLEPILINDRYAESIYTLSEDGKPEYTNSLGYLVIPQWAVKPDSVSYTCWPYEIWNDPQTPEHPVSSLPNGSFFAQSHFCIYEITATWKGSEYFGTATYYLYTMVVSNCQVEETPTSGGPTLLRLDDVEATLGEEDAKVLAELLPALEYDPMKVCRCLPQYTLDIPNIGTFGIHLGENYARCDQGQAELTPEQTAILQQIIEPIVEAYTP